MKRQLIRVLIILAVNFFTTVPSSFLCFSKAALAQDEISSEKSSRDSVTSNGTESSMPEIDVWYGSHQTFGHSGMPQRWINIPGRVSDPDGIAALTFSLNDGSEFPLNIGPDGRRLAAPGDFNIEINIDDVHVGPNQIVIRAIDNLDNQAVKAITISYEENTWPLPYTIDWKTVKDMQYAVQIVDGRWIIDEDGIRTHPAYVGYDRIIAIGDMSWKDYEITVPITVHKIDTTSYDSQTSIGPGLGVNLGWIGHTNSPVFCSQPHCGWEPKGGSNWYEFRRDLVDRLRIVAAPPAGNPESTVIQLEMDKTYWLKARVETTPDGNIYRLKMWEDGKESEPPTWSLQKLTDKMNVTHGSILFVAHHVDATFGKVSVVSLEQKSHGKLFAKLKNYLVKLPFFIVWLTGVFLSLKHWNRYPAVSRLTLVAILILFGESVFAVYLDQQLPVIIQQLGLGNRWITRISLVKGVVQAFVTAVAWSLLIFAMFRWRSERAKKII